MVERVAEIFIGVGKKILSPILKRVLCPGYRREREVEIDQFKYFVTGAASVMMSKTYL